MSAEVNRGLTSTKGDTSMTPSFDHGNARRRARAVATAVSALAVGSAAIGVSTARAATAHSHPARSHQATSANRILRVVETGNDPQASRTTQKQYIDPQSGVRYLRMDQYDGHKINYVAWESDTPQANGKRAVDEINVNPVHKTWTEQSATLSPLPAPSLGIQSSGHAVKQAIQHGKATEEGLTKIDRHQVLKLSLAPSEKSERHVALYVDPATDVPAAETDVITSKRYTFTVRSDWEQATPRVVSRIESKPASPAGYSKSQIH
jgi:hypothetical protein